MREDVYQRLCELDARLVERGYPALTPWWLDVFRRLLEGRANRRLRRLVARVGRRGGKSSSFCKLVVALALYGGWSIPPGDVGYVLILAVSLPVARKRLHNCRKICQALGVATVPHEGGFRIDGTNIAFAALAARHDTSVGDTCIVLFCDEVARWRDDATGSNPATEVLRSVRPAIADQRGAIEILSSSPFSTLDAHHAAFVEGDTDEQMVAWAPTWVARPNLPEADCRKLEPDEPTFQREYGAIPMAAGAAVFLNHDAIDAAYKMALDVTRVAGDVLTSGADFGFEVNASGLAVVRRRGDRQAPILLREMKPKPGEPLKPSETVRAFALELRALGLDCTMADALYRQSIIEHLAEHRLHLLDAPVDDVAAPFVDFRVKLHQGRLSLAGAPAGLVRDLKELKSRPTANGRISIIKPKRADGSHADVLSALVLATWQPAGYVVPGEPPKPADLAEQEMLERSEAAYAGDDDDDGPDYSWE